MSIPIDEARAEQFRKEWIAQALHLLKKAGISPEALEVVEVAVEDKGTALKMKAVHDAATGEDKEVWIYQWVKVLPTPDKLCPTCGGKRQVYSDSKFDEFGVAAIIRCPDCKEE